MVVVVREICGVPRAAGAAAGAAATAVIRSNMWPIFPPCLAQKYVQFTRHTGMLQHAKIGSEKDITGRVRHPTPQPVRTKHRVPRFLFLTSSLLIASVWQRHTQVGKFACSLSVPPTSACQDRGMRGHSFVTASPPPRWLPRLHQCCHSHCSCCSLLWRPNQTPGHLEHTHGPIFARMVLVGRSSGCGRSLLRRPELAVHRLPRQVST